MTRAETTKASTTTIYAYDAFGQRVQKAGPLGDERYAYDESGRLLGVYDATGMPTEELVYLDGWRPVATVRTAAGSPTIFPILTDHLGTPRKILDPSTGSTLWSWDAKEPFGNQAPVSPSGFVFHGRFPGQRFDPETQLVHNGFRTYHPQAGRYVQSDPLGLEAGWNSFAYVADNPLWQADFFGLKPGDLFASAEDAARDALFFYRQPTDLNKRKYAGLIYRKGDAFYATAGFSGTLSASSPDLGRGECERNEGTEIATYHTHPPFLDKNGNYTVPSKSITIPEILSRKDIVNSRIRRIPTYMGHPNGQVHKYDPKNNDGVFIFNLNGSLFWQFQDFATYEATLTRDEGILK